MKLDCNKNYTKNCLLEYKSPRVRGIHKDENVRGTTANYQAVELGDKKPLG